MSTDAKVDNLYTIIAQMQRKISKLEKREIDGMVIPALVYPPVVRPGESRLYTRNGHLFAVTEHGETQLTGLIKPTPPKNEEPDDFDIDFLEMLDAAAFTR